MGYKKLKYKNSSFLEIIHPKKKEPGEKKRINYYPFGLKHKEYNNVVNGTENPYKYNGKELNEELGLDWYDFGARNYDASLGKWMNVDPLAGTMPSWSPYNFVFNNPLRFIDPLGLAPDGTDDTDDIAFWNNPISLIDPDGGATGNPGCGPGFFKRLFNKIGKFFHNNFSRYRPRTDVAWKWKRKGKSWGMWGHRKEQRPNINPLMGTFLGIANMNSTPNFDLTSLNTSRNRNLDVIPPGGFRDIQINFTPITLGDMNTNSQSRLINNAITQNSLKIILNSLQSQPNTTVRFQFGQTVRGVIDTVYAPQIRDWNQRRYKQLARYLMSNGIDHTRMGWDESDPNEDLRMVRIKINP